MGLKQDTLKLTQQLRKQFRKGAPISSKGDHVFDGVWGSMVVDRETGRCILDNESKHFIVWTDEDGEHSPWRAKDWFRPATNKEIEDYYG